MNDNDLIDELRDGMRARTDHTEVPEGFADRARRTARRRSARRATAVGTPLLAAAGVATVLATSGGSGGSSPGAAQAPNVAVGGGQAHDTAYVVRRVKAKVAADSQTGTVIHAYAYGTGDLSPDGSLVNFKDEVYNGYQYTAPDGAEYWRGTLYDGDGTSFGEIDYWVPGANGKDTSTRILINLAKKTYSQNVYEDNSSPSEGPAPNLLSSPSQVQQTLQSGQVTEKGMATINGTQAIALSATLPKGPGPAASEKLTVYVDAQTYQPLRTLYIYGGHFALNPEVNDWVPATSANIAMAKDDSIPAGYTKVAKAY